MYKQAAEILSLIVNAACIIHYYYYSGRNLRKVGLFFGGTLLLGTIAEITAILATGGYDYPGFTWYIGPIPLFIAIGWGSVFYFAYHAAKVMARPFEGRKGYYWAFAFAAGLTALLYDLNVDPVAARLEWWIWKEGSSYFGVPASNFWGWFALCFGFCTSYKWVMTKKWSTPKLLLIYFLLILATFAGTILTTIPFMKVT